MFCQKCGNELKEGAAFCSRCGARQGEVLTAAPASSMVPSASGKKQGRKGLIIGVAAVCFMAVLAVIFVAVFVLGRQDKEDEDEISEEQQSSSETDILEDSTEETGDNPINNAHVR